jgi:colanic acid/amylovoran biosynthesis glycosyltransferase
VLQLLANELGISEIVSFLGWRDQRAVALLMQESDALLAPSVTDAAGDQEGIPVTLMEAMATGMPVVATRHSGIPELVEDGVSGFLAPERDARGLADALERLAQDADLAARVGRAARARIAAAFDIRLLNDRLVAHYRGLLDGTPEFPQPTSEEASAGRRGRTELLKQGLAGSA